jgi:ATP-dependent exoDNAse (exonuclease V) beta subunit
MTSRSPQANTDEAARAQIREDLGSTLMVEAGAGTGKTSALVDRVVSLVLAGKPVERIAAITFTEKAATELRDRIRSGLEAAKSNSPGDVIDAALESLDRCQVSTIHAFCQSLLRSFAARSGTDPSFKVSDEVKADRRTHQRWGLFLDALVEDEASSATVQRVMGLGMPPGDLETLAKDLGDRRELVHLFEASPFVVDAATWPDLNSMAAELERVAAFVAEGEQDLKLKLHNMASLVSSLLAAPPRDRESVLAASAGTLDLKLGARRDEVRTVLKGLSAELQSVLDACRTEALANLTPIIVGYVKAEAEQRQRDGELTFDDLIVCTRDLLATDPGAVAALRRRYDALLIDEFQDTDPLQVDIAMAFGTDPATGKLEPGRLFLVGDPKQSIYRFRRADMGMYARTRKIVEVAGGEFPPLQVNRRSRPQVLSWVNHVFESLIGTGHRPDIQPPYRAIFEHRGDAAAGPGVACFGGEAAKGVMARAVRELEAADAARVCRTAVEGGWEVWDVRERVTRRATYKDIALLIPSRLILASLEAALARAQVPYRVEGGSLVYRTQEVRDLLNCLTAINDPDDEVAVVAALRSPAFACSDVDLARHRAAGGYFNYNRVNPEKGDERVRNALTSLGEYHSARQDTSLARLVERFVAERMLVETGVLDRGDRNAFRRTRFVVEQARVFESDGPESLREFVAWLENRSGRDFLDNEGAGLDDDEEAVRILTIHAAKGLEFPIVLMVGMGADSYGRPGTYLADHGDGKVGVRIGTESANRVFAVGPYDHLKAIEKEHRQAEFVRMLYVAATRARDHLVVSLHRRTGANASAAALLEEAGARDLSSTVDLLPADTVERVSHLGDLRVDVPVYATVDEFLSARDDLVSRSRRQLFTSATAEVRETREGAAKEDSNDEMEPWARGRGGTRLGRAVHATIQSLRWDADAELIGSFARAQAVAEAIPHRADQIARLAERALRSEAGRRALSARRALREVPFAVQAGNVTLEGFIDLLIEGEDGLEVVDWKTDQIGAGEVEARLAEYRLQAGLYVWGVQEATGKRVSRVTYVFVSAGQEVAPGDPQELAEDARRHLATKTTAPPPR